MADQNAPSSLRQEQPFSRLLPHVALISLMFLLTYLDRAMFGPFLPRLEEEFGISHAASTRLLLFMSLGYSASMLFSGFSSSKVRPRVLVTGAVIGTGLVLLLLSVSTSLPLLALLFAVLGMAAGQYFNGGLSSMRSFVPPAQWSKAISIHEIGPNASFFIAPLLVEMGTRFFGWRDTVLYMGWLTIAAGILFFFLGKGGEYPAAPVSFKGVRQKLKEPKLWLFTWLMGIAIAGEFAPYSVLVMHMTDERAFAPDTASFLLSVTRIGAPFAVLGGGLITARFGTRRPLLFCLLVYTVGMCCMALPFTVPFVIGMTLQPLFTAMIFPPIFTLLAESFPMRDQPLLLAIGMPLASFMGVGFMPFLLGLWGDHYSFSAGFLMMACMVALSLPLLRLMPADK